MKKKRKTRIQIKRAAVALCTFLFAAAIMSAFCIVTDGEQEPKTVEAAYKAELTIAQPIDITQEVIEAVTDTAQAAQNEPQCDLTDEDENICDNEPTTPYLSESDALTLAKLAMAEAEGESVEGKALVICVVFNRVKSDEFPDTIPGVVFQTGQFSPVCEGGRYYTTEPDEECYEALELVLNGWDESSGALYFESSEKSTWHSRNLEFLFQYGGHKFYK